ncbi:MAG: hypothetical protein J1F36_05385 [Clostridiales bacterium]|nr:hypothetical protein [Clostridiales bacterium]
MKVLNTVFKILVIIALSIVSLYILVGLAASFSFLFEKNQFAFYLALILFTILIASIISLSIRAKHSEDGKLLLNILRAVAIVIALLSMIYPTFLLLIVIVMGQLHYIAIPLLLVLLFSICFAAYAIANIFKSSRERQ